MAMSIDDVGTRWHQDCRMEQGNELLAEQINCCASGATAPEPQEPVLRGSTRSALGGRLRPSKLASGNISTLPTRGN
jgi:hypothetical protein